MKKGSIKGNGGDRARDGDQKNEDNFRGITNREPLPPAPSLTPQGRAAAHSVGQNQGDLTF